MSQDAVNHQTATSDTIPEMSPLRKRKRIKQVVKCPGCKSSSDIDEWLGCDNCEEWWHRDCLPAENRALADMSLIMPDTVKFFCPFCSVLSVCGVCLVEDRKNLSQWCQCSCCGTDFHINCFPNRIQKEIKRQRKSWMCNQCNSED